MAEKKPLCNYGGEVRELQSGDSLPSSFSVVGNNLLINSAGLINQRGYLSGTATTIANQYTLDRWRVVTSGQNLTYSTSGNITTFNAPSGGIEQVVENLNIQGGSYVLSFDGTATAEVAQSSDNSTYSTVAPSNGVYAITAGYYVRIRFSDGTFGKPKFERGNISTPFILDNYISDLQACRRYYLFLTFVLYVYGAYGNYGGSIVSMGIARMRVQPTISYSSILSSGWVGDVNAVQSLYYENSIIFYAGVMQTNPGAANRIKAVMVAEL